MEQYLDRLKDALADKYAIERELGSGGMATVFLARDVKHDRLVAVKVLSPELAASLGAERFLREIQITAKLSHPHILPLYDSGEAGGLLYYVMPYVPGESLADLIAREQQLSIKDAVQIAREVAEALAQAHALGLIHRDIKPQNILMSGGHAIVADFGIATAVSQAAGEKLTQTGMSIGTPAYMSPEQAMAVEQLDGRSDIYSLGCVLYEMLVGQIPFTGPTPQAIMARHSMDHVTPPHIMRDTISEPLEDIILRAMAKVPADRFRTAFEMAEALGAVDTTTTAQRRLSVPAPAVSRGQPWRRALIPAGVALGVVALAGGAWALFGSRRGSGATSAGGLDPRHVAVLYFEDLSRDSSLAHVADGLTEGLIEELSHVRPLDVTSRNGVAPFRAADLPRDSVARALQVGSLVEGSIEPAGGRLRVTARLVDGTSGADLERASFELPAEQLLTVRDSVVREVARLLRRRLGEEVQVRSQRATTASADAWGLVQRGERLRKQGVEQVRQDRTRALQLYEGADSVAALAQAADAKWVEPLLLRGEVAYNRASLQASLAGGGRTAVPVLEEGLKWAGRALEIGPGNPKALELRGRLRYRLWFLKVTPDPVKQARLLDSAQGDLEAAVRADPTLANAHYVLSRLYYQRKDNFAALMAARRAYEEDAYLSNTDASLNQLFWTHYDLEQFTDAERWCREGARRFPNDHRFVECRLWMMTTPGADVNPGEAWRLARVLDSLAPKGDSAVISHRGRLVVGGALARAGLTDSARHVLEAARAGREIDPKQELLGYEAIMWVIIGDYDRAIDRLKAYVAVNPDHEFNVQGDLHWWWRPLRDRPGFQAVAARR